MTPCRRRERRVRQRMYHRRTRLIVPPPRPLSPLLHRPSSSPTSVANTDLPFPSVSLPSPPTHAETRQLNTARRCMPRMLPNAAIPVSRTPFTPHRPFQPHETIPRRFCELRCSLRRRSSPLDPSRTPRTPQRRLCRHLNLRMRRSPPVRPLDNRKRHDGACGSWDACVGAVFYLPSCPRTTAAMPARASPMIPVREFNII